MLKASGDMILREVAGENILIPVGAMALKVHGMVNLSESGALLWQRLQQPCTGEDLVECIVGEYDVDRDTARQDVQEFLQKLEELGALERSEGDSL